jgi:hypothetical protein
MNTEDTPGKTIWYGPLEGYESRCQRRLQDDLGVDEAAAETILHLRDQVIALQSCLRQLEVELASQRAGQEVRLAGYREAIYEATWIELEFQE